MTHEHLGLDLTDRFNCNTDNDEDGGAAQCQSMDAGNRAENDRQDCDNTKEQGAD